MGRTNAAAALAVLCLLPDVAAGECELFVDEALGVALEAPSGYEVEEPARAEGGNAAAFRLGWREGPYAGLDVVVVRRDAAYANVVIWAGLYQRRLGASSSFEAEAEPLSRAELERVGAEDGVRVSYEIGEGSERRRLQAAFLASGETFYRLEISYPARAVARLGGVAQKMMDTFEISPAVEGRTRGTKDVRENGEPAPAE